MVLRRLVLCTLFGAALFACGPSSSDRACGDITRDVNNCGYCGNICSDGQVCVQGLCVIGDCAPGDIEDCYTGTDGTQDVGPCHGGSRICESSATWSRCQNEVVPGQEICSDGVDNNCNGTVDEDADLDHDGFTTCGGDCCDSTECEKPETVNPGAFDAPGNGVDDDCNGVVDDSISICDQALTSDTSDAMDYAKAIDLCQTATETDRHWGVISAALTLPDGTGTPDPNAHSIRRHFGAMTLPQGGLSMVLISSGVAASKGDIKPDYHDWVSYSSSFQSAYPADFYAANGNQLPNAPNCPAPNGTIAHDPVMLTFRIRVPTNAHSFRLATNFYSAEFPEWTCSPYNDFFVVLLDSTYAGMPANPTDKNLAFYQAMGSTQKVPVGVNLASGNTGLFTQCVNGTTGCSGTQGTIQSCVSTNLLLGTGFDDPTPGSCDATSLKGGSTGWLVTAGNVQPGEIMTLRVAIWDTSDSAFDSLAIIDGFQWSIDAANPGTVIFKGAPDFAHQGLGELAASRVE